MFEELGLGDSSSRGCTLRPDRRAGPRGLARAGRTDQGRPSRGRDRVVGKYVELHDAYLSVREALHHAAWAHERDAKLHWIDSEALDQGRTSTSASRALPASSSRVASATAAWRARSSPHSLRATPQSRTSGCAWACRRCHRVRAPRRRLDRREFDRVRPVHAHPVIDLMPEQRDVEDKGATMRLGPVPVPAHARLARPRRSTARRSSSSGIAIATSSTTATARCSRRRARPVRGSRRTAASSRSSSSRSPVVRGQPVPPRVQEPAQAAASVVRRVRRGIAGRGRRQGTGAATTTRGGHPGRESETADGEPATAGDVVETVSGGA